MSEIRVLENKLYINQEETEIVFANTGADGLKIEQHFTTTDGGEIDMLLALNASEKAALVEYLFEGRKETAGN